VRSRDDALRALGDKKLPGNERLANALHDLGVSVDGLLAATTVNRESLTALTAAREALAAERASFQMLFEYALDGYLVTDSAGVVQKANRTAAELFGVPRGHLIRKPIAVFVALAERRAFRVLLQRVGDGKGSLFTFEATLEARGGRRFNASIRVATGPAELRWTIRDMTELHNVRQSLSDARQALGKRTIDLATEVGERRQADLNLVQSEDRYRLLAAHLHEGLEEERTRIAREVHDELGAALTAIRFELSGAGSGVQVDESVRRAIDRVDEAIQATRRICSGLRPSLLDHMGLWAAIEWLVEDVAGRAGIQCKLELNPGSELAEPARTAVFRIVQEAVTNTVRHAKASRLRVSARASGGELEIRVADDGCGIPAAELARPDAFGLAGMQERARACCGRIVIEPAKRGTQVLLRVPFPTEADPCAS